MSSYYRIYDFCNHDRITSRQKRRNSPNGKYSKIAAMRCNESVPSRRIFCTFLQSFFFVGTSPLPQEICEISTDLIIKYVGHTLVPLIVRLEKKLVSKTSCIIRAAIPFALAASAKGRIVLDVFACADHDSINRIRSSLFLFMRR